MPASGLGRGLDHLLVRGTAKVLMVALASAR